MSTQNQPHAIKNTVSMNGNKFDLFCVNSSVNIDIYQLTI